MKATPKKAEVERNDNPEKVAERERFLDFIGPDPDLKDIAKKTGLGYQALYYVVSKRNYVSGDMHREMAKVFPNYNLEWQILGADPAKKDVVGSVVSSADKPSSQLAIENTKLRIENEYLRRERDNFEQEKSNYWKLLETLHEQKLDFSVVSSQTTDKLFPFNNVPAFVDPKFSDFRLMNDKKVICPPWALPGVTDIAGAIKE